MQTSLFDRQFSNPKVYYYLIVYIYYLQTHLSIFAYLERAQFFLSFYLTTITYKRQCITCILYIYTSTSILGTYSLSCIINTISSIVNLPSLFKSASKSTASSFLSAVIVFHSHILFNKIPSNKSL